MGPKLAEHLSHIEYHANMLMSIPAGELFIGQIQFILDSALREIKATIEELEKLKKDK